MARLLDVGSRDSKKEVIAVFGKEHCEPMGNGFMMFSYDSRDQMDRLGVPWKYEKHYDNGVCLIIPRDKQLEVQVGFANVVIQDF